MAKLILKPWKCRSLTTEVTSERELSEEEMHQVWKGITYASISCCVPGWRQRTLQQIKDVLEDFYGKQLADNILDVKYI